MRLEGATIAVTGATGFLGRYIVSALQARGARVIGAVRNPDRVPELRAQGVEMRRCDLADRESLVAAFAGADAIVSNAALFRISNVDWDQHVETNVRGTENVMHAAAEAGVSRIVHVSSCAVYRMRANNVVDEDHPQFTEADRNRFNAYPVSKALSEQAAWRIASERELALTTVRPSAIYGAFDPNLMPMLRRLVEGPIAWVPVWARLPIVHAGDVAEAIAAALENDASTGRPYNTAGPDVAPSEILAAWREAGGRVGMIRVPVPVPFRLRVDSGRAARELGFRNRPYVEGFREILAREGAR